MGQDEAADGFVAWIVGNGDRVLRIEVADFQGGVEDQRAIWRRMGRSTTSNSS